MSTYNIESQFATSGPPASQAESERLIGRELVHALHDEFAAYYGARGYLEEEPVPVSSGIDKTVRFVGSHISVFKPYLENDSVPFPGMYMTQNCLRTRNVKRLLDEDFDPAYGSFFTSMGVLAPAERLQDFCEDAFQFLGTLAGSEATLRVNISSHDTDLLEACSCLPSECLAIDTKPETYYQHKIGMDSIRGRNFNIALPAAQSDSYEDVGNVIILEKQDGVRSVELALGDLTILKQTEGFEHILDTYGLLLRDTLPGPLRHKFADAVITTVVLFGEGIRPGASNNQSRLLRSYAKALANFRQAASVSYDELAAILAHAEERCLPITTSCYNEVVEYVRDYDAQIRSGTIHNKEDRIIHANLLGRTAIES